ncbi:NAD(P)-binding domain-containing protein [Sporosarcina sp. P3]|uniref:NAD(P)-binding domain-containing protein n=1 Tax=Sporosarcina sp. P3 TaxID=2048245 RepID=UPI0013040D8F|nr:NAD(P)-binding domain-containing protein [Sporosarcina sp. P3]
MRFIIQCAIPNINIEEALVGADVVFVTIPATAHASVAKSCAPYLQDGQLVI